MEKGRRSDKEREWRAVCAWNLGKCGTDVAGLYTDLGYERYL